MFFLKLFIVCVLLNTSVFAQEWTDSTTEDWYTYPTPGPINCGGNITELYGEFATPNYPNNYPINVDCVWIITSPNWEPYIWLDFSTFNTEAGYDFLELRAGPDYNAPLIRRMTGDLSQCEYIESYSRHIWAWFHSDYTGVSTGFRAYFNVGTASTIEPTRATDPYESSTVESISTPEPSTVDTSTIEPASTPPTTGCGESFTNTWGTFNSPEFPFYYPFNSDCEWRFTAPPGFRVHITLGQQLSLEHDRECAYDYVEFRDGPNPDSPLLTRICGYHEEPLAITSTLNSLYARFHSDDQINAQGFVGIYHTRQVQKLEVEKRKEQN